MVEFRDVTDTAPVTVTERKKARGLPRAYLVVMRGKPVGKMFPIERSVRIGRGDQVDICIDDNGISREHVEIDRNSDGHFFIRDLGSRNGVKVNGVQVSHQELQFGDRIELGGSTCLKFIYQDELEIQLQESHRLEAIGRLAGGVAHEFNNLLTVVINNLAYIRGLVVAGETGQEQQMLECIDDSLDESRRGAQLTNSLLGFARRRPFEPTAIDLEGLVKNFVRLIGRTLESNIQVNTEVAPDLFVFCDDSQIHQVLLNLALNAQDAMPNGGVLTVSAQRVQLGADDEAVVGRGVPVGSYVEVLVRDTGVGIDESTRQRMFEPFFSGKAVGEGTGLGLSLALGIIQSHNGHLTVKSGPGEGAEFRIYLPAIDVEQQPLANAREITGPTVAQITHGTVLVVDDQAGVRRSVARLLKEMGHQVILASGGESAVETYRLRGKEIGVVLLDLKMPSPDGEATFYQLRTLDPDVRVVLCTGHDSDKRVAELQKAGVFDVLSKPFEVDALANIVGNALYDAGGVDHGK